MMGMFPPGTLPESEMLTQTQLDGFNMNGRGMPPINIRNADALNTDLGRDPLPNGFVSVPVHNFNNPTVDDDLNESGCTYV
jgi:hypothetical protein